MNGQNPNNLGQNPGENLGNVNPQPAVNNTTANSGVYEANTPTPATPTSGMQNPAPASVEPAANPTPTAAPTPSPTEPVATPIPGTENVSNMPNNIGGGIGQEPGISLGTINNNGFVEPTKIEDIGAVPPKQEKPKRPMNKVLFIIFLILSITGTTF